MDLRNRPGPGRWRALFQEPLPVRNTLVQNRAQYTILLTPRNKFRLCEGISARLYSCGTLWMGAWVSPKGKLRHE